MNRRATLKNLLIAWAYETKKTNDAPTRCGHSIIYDEKKNRATGVRINDANTLGTVEFYA